MANLSYIIRNYRPSDFDKYVLLNIEAEKLESMEHHTLHQTISELLKRPNYAPEHDLFIVETGGNLVSYMDMTPELPIGRIILNCWVHPDHRQKGLATRLLCHAMRRAKELGAKLVQSNIPEENAIARRVLSQLGFNPVRRFSHLQLDISKISEQDLRQATSRYRHLRPGDEDKLTRIQNRSFAGTWGYNPNTVETITYLTHLSNSSPEHVILFYDGDNITGYCWIGITGSVESSAIGKRGRIFMLGVDPDYRGRGTGRRVLMCGLAHLKNKGLEIAELTVDSENTTACTLYLSIGFEVLSHSLWYEKQVSQDTEA